MEWKRFPTNFSEIYYSLSKEKPYVTILTGGYQNSFSVEGISHRYWVYYPKGMEYSCKNLLLLLPNTETVEEFLAKTGWVNVADQEHLLLMMAGGKEDPWLDWADAEKRMQALDNIRNDRTYMDNQRALSYFIGYQEGAEFGHRFVVKNPSLYASCVFCGAVQTEKAWMEKEGDQETAASDIPKKDVPCPVCFVGSPSVPEWILSYWRRANCSEELPYQQGKSTIWIPNMAQLESTVEHQPVARVQFTNIYNAETPEVTNFLWRSFLSRTVRSTGILNGDLHPYRTAQQWGLQRRELSVDGWMRHWYEYLPERLAPLTKKTIPVVVCLHGGSATALSNLYAHEWVQVAKERGFLLILPTGTMRRQDAFMPHPAWNAARVKDHMDDEKFLRQMVANIQSRHPVDMGRVYICGHSMGAAMTQRAALAMPDLFTAAASNSGVVTGGFMGDFDSPGIREDLSIPIWIQMGEKDIGGGTRENNPHADRTVRYWVNRYGLSDPDHPYCWRTGRYLNQEWHTEKGVPMVRYTTTREKPHAMTPQDPWLYYDEFFCRFSKDEKGILYYEGKPVE